MELRHLRYFVTVAEELHFTRAAARLGVKQPPLSQQILQLEEEVGTKLLSRSTRNVELTSAGEAFLIHARKALRQVETATEAATRSVKGESGQLRIGFTSGASFNYTVLSLVADFRHHYSGVELVLMEGASNHLLEALDAELIDIAFIRPTAQQRAPLDCISFPNEGLCVALPSNHPFSSMASLSMAELNGERFILFPRKNSPMFYDEITDCCRQAGFSPNIVQVAPQLTSVINLVAMGVGISLVPESLQSLRPDSVTYLSIDGPAPCARLWLCRNRASAIAATARNFIRHANIALAKGR